MDKTNFNEINSAIKNISFLDLKIFIGNKGKMNDMTVFSRLFLYFKLSDDSAHTI